MSQIHFEIHVDNISIAKTFYANLFDWTFHKMTDAGYHFIAGEGIGAKQPISGALIARNAPTPKAGSGPRGAIMTFIVEDVDQAYASALATGGAEALPPTDFDGIGRLAYCEDGQGNIFGMKRSIQAEI